MYPGVYNYDERDQGLFRREKKLQKTLLQLISRIGKISADIRRTLLWS